MDFRMPSTDTHIEGVVFCCTLFGLSIGALCARCRTISLVLCRRCLKRAFNNRNTVRVRKQTARSFRSKYLASLRIQMNVLVLRFPVARDILKIRNPSFQLQLELWVHSLGSVNARVPSSYPENVHRTHTVTAGRYLCVGGSWACEGKNALNATEEREWAREVINSVT